MATAAMRALPWWLSAPALLLYAVFLFVPLASVATLSVYGFKFYGGIQESLTAKNYIEILTDGYFWEIYARTLFISVAVTLACAVIGTFEAIVLHRMAAPWKALFLMIVLGPLLVSVVVRTLGWALLFGSTGLVNKWLLAVGALAEPLPFMYTHTGIVVGLTHVLVPFVVIAVWASLQRIDPASERAAISLGASGFTVVRRIVLPQVMPGLLSGCVMVFALAASAFATPAILGGRKLKVVATAAYDEFLNTLNWPLGAALATLLLVVTATVLVTANRLIERRYAPVFGN